jgi:hypothetical protein
VETTNSKISQTSDGGYILAGGTSSSDGDVSGYYGDTDIWVVKLSNNGTIQWQKCLGASNFETTNSNISQTSDGGYILAGITFSNIWNNGDVIGHHGGGDIWVVKLNNTGAIQWQKCLGGIDSEGFESDISQTSDGGYIVAGSTSSSDGDVSGNHPFGDFWVVKLSNTGTIQWQKYLGGSEGEYQTTKISQTSDGGFIFAGVTTSNDGDVSGNHGGEDIWVVKLSPEVLSSTSFLENSISIYPNPVLSILNINTDYQLINQHYTIIDGLGRVVLNGKLNEVESTINVEQLSKGIYYLKLSDKRARKFIKE